MHHQIHYDNTNGVGMGDLLCFISLICSAPNPVEILVSNSHGTYDKLTMFKRVLNIPDYRFIVTLKDSVGTFHNYGWPLKLFSDYYETDIVNLFGNNMPVKRNNFKGYIGLVCYNGSGHYMNDDHHLIQWDHNKTMTVETDWRNWPQTRYRPVSFYSRIFEYCKTHDYDVITLESASTSFEEKIELMTKYCKAIIGFEGGIAHLSHMLKIPYFMLDWRHPSPSTTNGDLHCELVHLSPYLYMLRDDEELFSWSKEEFNDKIYQTELGKGNNRFVTGHRKFNFDRDGVLGNIQVTDEQNNKILDMGKLFGNNELGTFMKQYFQDRHKQI